MAMLYIATTINGRIALANADGVGLMKLGTNMKNVQDLILTRTGRTKTMANSEFTEIETKDGKEVQNKTF